MDEPPARAPAVSSCGSDSEDGTWRAVYAFTDPARSGVFGIRVDTGDLTGDAIADLLSFEDLGGSGACGRTG